MQTNTLPPGWTGNDADHHVTAGPFKIHVSRASTYNPFIRRNERTGGYRWAVTCGAYTKPLAESASLGHPDAKEARKHGIDAVRVLILGANEMIDWLRMHPMTTEPTPTQPAALDLAREKDQ